MSAKERGQRRRNCDDCSRLMGLLSKAAPHATVMLLNDYKERNAQPIKSLEVCGLEWTIELG